MHTSRRKILIAGAVALSASLPAMVYGQDDNYPSRPISFIIPFPPGGTADGFARPLAQALSQRVGQPVVIENRPGANGNIGSAIAAHKPADGYTLLYGSAGTLAVNPYIYPNMGYDPLKDLEPVIITHQMPNVLVVGSDTPYKNVSDLIADAKANPNKLSYASAGNGNSMHLAAEQFLAATGTKMMHVPYKGGPEAINDILGGRVPLMFNNLPAIVPLVESGKLRALAVADTKRSPLLPNVPTMAEAGVPNFTNVAWAGFLVRKGTDPRIIQRLSDEMRAILQTPKFKAPQEAQGFEIVASTPQEFARILNNDSKIMGELLERIGIRIK